MKLLKLAVVFLAISICNFCLGQIQNLSVTAEPISISCIEKMEKDFESDHEQNKEKELFLSHSHKDLHNSFQR